MISLNCLFEQEEDSKGQYKVPMIEKLKTHKLNPRTNRMKNFKTIKYLFTDIAPEERTFKNLPRYANKDPKVRFQDWLEIDAKKRHPIIRLLVGVGLLMVSVMGGVIEPFMDLKLVK